MSLPNNKTVCSFLVPVCVDFKMFKTCIYSILEQKDSNSSDITIIDDGSSKECSILAKRLLKKKRNLYIHTCNTENLIREKISYYLSTNGKYVILVNPCVEFDLNFVKKLTSATFTHNPDVIRLQGCTAETRHTKVKTFYNYEKDTNKLLSGSKALSLFEKPNKQFMNFSFYAFSRELLKKIEYNNIDERYLSDFSLIPSLLVYASKVISLDYQGIILHSNVDMFQGLKIKNNEQLEMNKFELLSKIDDSIKFFKQQKLTRSNDIINLNNYYTQQKNTIKVLFNKNRQ